jgi:hypothetical protein
MICDPQGIRTQKDDAALPQAAKGRNLHSVGDKIPKVRRLLKVRNDPHDWSIHIDVNEPVGM